MNTELSLSQSVWAMLIVAALFLIAARIETICPY